LLLPATDAPLPPVLDPAAPTIAPGVLSEGVVGAALHAINPTALQKIIERFTRELMARNFEPGSVNRSDPSYFVDTFLF
jgi:hypothetical protein